MKLPIALQLWSVREDMAKDYKATRRRVKELGFDGVEFAGFFGVDAHEMKKTLDELGLKVAGSHTQPTELAEDLDGVIEYNKIIGNKNIVVVVSSLKPYDKVEVVDELVNLLKPMVKKLHDNGMELHYHNHYHEFTDLGGELALDRLYRLMPAEEISPQIDTYWAYYACGNPVGKLKEYGDRVKLIHLKDGDKNMVSAPIGEGEVDIQLVLDTACDIGAEWVIMEDETKDPKGFDSVSIGMKNLKEKFHF